MSEVKTRAERIALKVRRKQRLVRVALGEEKADVVLKNADYVNVFSGTIEHGDIAVANGLVVGMADHYDGLMEVDVSGKSSHPASLTRIFIWRAASSARPRSRVRYCPTAQPPSSPTHTKSRTSAVWAASTT